EADGAAAGRGGGAGVLVSAHAAPCRHVGGRGGVVGGDGDDGAHTDVTDAASQFDHRQRTARASAIQRQLGGRVVHDIPACSRRRVMTSASTLMNRSTSSWVTSAPSETRTLPCVSAPIAART